MADSTAHEAAEGVANLHLDDVTGEKVSKTELKRRQKLRAQEEKKQQRAAAAPPKAEKKRPAEDDESNLTPSVRDSQICVVLSLKPYFNSNTSKYEATELRD
jgi:lysyl-tRNA synthetase, class II